MKKAVHKKQKKVVKKTSLKLRDKGVSKVAIIAIVAVVLVGAGGYFVLGQQKQGSGSSALPFMKPALNPNCKYNDPNLCKFINNSLTLRDSTETSTMKNGDMTIEYVAQMNSKGYTHTVSKENGKENANIIVMGDTIYTLDYKDNKWWKQTTKVDTTNTDVTPTSEPNEQQKIKEDEAKDTSTFTFIDKEACGNLTCFKYEMGDSANKDGTTKQYVLFDDQDYLMRKLVMTTGPKEQNEVNFSYDSFTISAPSPVKEGTPGFGAGAGYSPEDAQKMMQQYQQNNPQDTTQQDNAPDNNANPPSDY